MMSQNELNRSEMERILTTEEDLQPMTGFSTRVMRAVREEAVAPQPIAFPWKRFLPGFSLSFGLLLVATIWVILEPGTPSQIQLIPTEWFSDPQAQGLLWASLALIGSGTMAWMASKLGAPRRVSFF